MKQRYLSFVLVVASSILVTCARVESALNPEDDNWRSRIAGPTNIDMRVQASEVIVILERRLNELLIAFNAQLDEEARKKFAAAQSAWEDFASKESDFLADRYRGGSHLPLEYLLVYIDHLIERIRTVKIFMQEYHTP